MKVTDMQLEDVTAILDIWKGEGGKVPSYITPQKVYGDLQRVAHDDRTARDKLKDGYRIGSQWTSNSKLAFDIRLDGEVHVKFRPNLTRDSEKSSTGQADEAAERFARKVDEYFTQKTSPPQ